MKKRSVIFFAGILAAVVLFVLTGGFLNKSDAGKSNVSYKEFYEFVEKGYVKSVVIKSDELEFAFNEKDFPEKEKFAGKNQSVRNPHSPVLEEYLLLNNVDVQTEKDSGEIITGILDAVFYIIFFGIIIIAFRKFISPNTFKVVHNTGKKFSDVVGMESLKKDMLQIMDMMKNPAEYKKAGIRMPKGILLEGNPGNGKTLFAKALAGEAKVNFIPAKATDFESMFMAIGPMKVKLLFRKARRRAPCIVFIDEFDGIGTKRNYSGSAIETENTRIVTALLNELDGFEPNKGILVLAATNSVSALDEALIRPGRFDSIVKVPYPDERSLVSLINMYLGTQKLESNVTTEWLVAKFKGFSCAKVESVINKSLLIAKEKGRLTVGKEDFELAVKSVNG